MRMTERQTWANWVGRLGSAANYYNVEGMRLFRLAQEQTERWIIEVGAWQGYTSLLMAAASLHLPDTKVLSVDLWTDAVGTQGPAIGGPETLPGDWIASRQDLAYFLYVAAESGLLSRILPLRMASIEAAEAWPIGAGLAGLIHFDATHTYEAAMEDVHAWLPHLAPGGVMAFHDYNRKRPGMMEAYDELSEEWCWTDQKVTGCLAEMRYNPARTRAGGK